MNHHGAASSSSSAFLALIRPEVAVISTLGHGGYHHPRQSVLDNLFAIPGITVYQTNPYEAGNPLGGNTAPEFIGDPERSEDDGHVVIRVEGASYVVTLPGTGHTQTFPIQGR